MTKVDACGRSCPEPVIMTKKAIVSKEKEYEITVDNKTAVENVSRFAEYSGYSVKVTENRDVYKLLLKLK